MSTPQPSTVAPEGGASDLIRVLDAYLADLHAGKAPDRAALLAAHPHLAAQLESCLAALDFIHHAERPDPAAPPALGDFRLVREIGRGGMGVVYEAEQVSLKRCVALKVLRFGGAADRDAMERFQREAETVARLHHTNIVPIFAVGCENGVHFFAMQLIAGRSLAAVIEEAKTQSQPLDAKTVAGWGVQAAEALAHAHARGVVHRDVKPSNLLLDAEGIVWLTDFGLARRSDETAMTQAGMLLGTPRYMSPEQASAVQKPVDERSDVYSLGATLYELATGRPVFEAQTATELMRQIAEVEPESPRSVRRDLPRDLETVLLKCLAKEPAQRYATAQELADDLRRVVSGDPVKARRPNVLMRFRRWATKQSRSSLVVGGCAVTLALLLVGLMLGIEAYRERQKGQLQIDTDGPLLRAEVLTQEGETVLDSFAIPTEKPITLPGGWYRVRVSAAGTLSADYEVLVQPGKLEKVSLVAREMEPPIPIDNDESFQIVNLRGRADILQRKGKKIVLVDGITHTSRWPKDLERYEVSPTDGLVQPAPSLMKKGVGDVLWAIPESEILGPAISGEDGHVLWTYSSSPCEPIHSVGDTVNTILAGFVSPLTVTAGLTARAGSVHGRLACSPVLTDIDGDGLPDVIALFAIVYTPLNLRQVEAGSMVLDPNHDNGDGTKGAWRQTPGSFAFADGWQQLLDERWANTSIVHTWVVAIKGNTGEQLWRYPLPVGIVEGTEIVAPDRFAVILTGTNDKPTVLVRAVRQAVTLDAKTGKEIRLINIEDPITGYLARGWHAPTNGQGLVRIHQGNQTWYSYQSTTDLTELWQPINHDWPPAHWGPDPYHLHQLEKEVRPEWRYFGSLEMVTATDIVYANDPDNQITIASLDLKTGANRWPIKQLAYGRPFQRQTAPDSTLRRLLAVGKPDGESLVRRTDGPRTPLRETAFLPRHHDDPNGCYLTAALLSGEAYGYSGESAFLLTAANKASNGDFIGRRLRPLAGHPPPVKRDLLGEGKFDGQIRWLPAGTNRPPYLAVSFSASNQESSQDYRPSEQKKTTCVYSANGQLQHVWPDTTALGTADFAGNGTPYLYGLYRPINGGAVSLHVAPLGPREIWRRPGRWRTQHHFVANENAWRGVWSL